VRWCRPGLLERERDHGKAGRRRGMGCTRHPPALTSRQQRPSPRPAFRFPACQGRLRAPPAPREGVVEELPLLDAPAQEPEPRPRPRSPPPLSPPPRRPPRLEAAVPRVLQRSVRTSVISVQLEALREVSGLLALEECRATLSTQALTGTRRSSMRSWSEAYASRHRSCQAVSQEPLVVGWASLCRANSLCTLATTVRSDLCALTMDVTALRMTSARRKTS
jgi:hypothetical protein